MQLYPSQKGRHRAALYPREGVGQREVVPVVAIGKEVSRQVRLEGTGEATWLELLALFQPLAEDLFGPETKVLAAECGLLKPVLRPATVSLSLKLVDKGGAGRVLWGRGLGHLEDGGAFSVVSLRVLLPATKDDHFGTSPETPPVSLA